MILLFGYLLSWVLFSLVITFPQYAMHQTGLLNPMMEPTHAYIGSIVLCLLEFINSLHSRKLV